MSGRLAHLGLADDADAAESVVDALGEEVVEDEALEGVSVLAVTAGAGEGGGGGSGA